MTSTSFNLDSALTNTPALEVTGYSAIESLTDASKAAGWDVEYRQIEAGKLESRICTKQIGNVNLLLESTNRRLEISATSPKDAYTILFAMPGPFAKLNGHRLQKHNAVILSPGAELYTLPPAGADVFSIHMDREIFDTTANSLLPGAKFLIRDNVLNLEFCRKIEQLRALATQAITNHLAPSDDKPDDSTIVEVVIQVISAAQLLSAKDTKYNQLQRQKILKRLAEYIECNIRGSITMTKLCEIGGISQSSLQRLFQRELGMTPYSYLQARRLEAARQQLLRVDGNQSIADIAANSGFNHMGRFAAAYRQQYGTLPSESRARS